MGAPAPSASHRHDLTHHESTANSTFTRRDDALSNIQTALTAAHTHRAPQALTHSDVEYVTTTATKRYNSTNLHAATTPHWTTSHSIDTTKINSRSKTLFPSFQLGITQVASSIGANATTTPYATTHNKHAIHTTKTLDHTITSYRVINNPHNHALFDFSATTTRSASKPPSSEEAGCIMFANAQISSDDTSTPSSNCLPDANVKHVGAPLENLDFQAAVPPTQNTNNHIKQEHVELLMFQANVSRSVATQTLENHLALRARASAGHRVRHPTRQRRTSRTS